IRSLSATYAAVPSKRICLSILSRVRSKTPFPLDGRRKIEFVSSGKQQDMPQQVGGFVGEGEPKLFLGLSVPPAAATEPVPDLRQLADLLLQFQHEPVRVALEAVVGRISGGGRLE